MGVFKGSLYILLFILSIGIVVAENCSSGVLPCQYQENSNCSYNADMFYISRFQVGHGLTFDSFEKSDGGRDSFKANNLLAFNIEVQIYFVQILTGAGGKFEKYGNNITVNISGNNYAKLITQYAFVDPSQSYATYIDKESITYKIVNPEDMIVKRVVINTNKTVCKMCSGVPCLDDGKPCVNDNQCGSGICNIAKFCGKEKIVDCSVYISGAETCNNILCVFPKSKKSGEHYNCESECAIDTKVCNNTCVTPSSKKAGQPYLCEWECSLNTIGKDGICRKSPKTILKEIVYWTIGIGLLLTLIWFFIVKKLLISTLDEITQRIKGLEKEEKTTVQNIDKLTNQAKISKKELIEKEDTLKSREEEIQSIKESLETINRKIEDAKEEAKKRFEAEYNSHSNELEEIRKNIKGVKGEVKEKFKIEYAKKEIELNKIDDKIKHAEDNAAKAFAEAYQREEKRLHNELEKQDVLIKTIADKKEELRKHHKELEEEISKEEKLIENRERLSKRKDELSIHEMARHWNLDENNLYINKKGYIQFIKSKDGTKGGMELHKYIYEKKVNKVPLGREIHHIDGNKVNDYLWNLIDLDENKHDRVDNMQIKNETWEHGLNYLLKNNLIKESELHDAIKEYRAQVKLDKR